MKKLIKYLLGQLERIEAARFQVMINIANCLLLGPIRTHYERLYGAANQVQAAEARHLTISTKDTIEAAEELRRSSSDCKLASRDRLRSSICEPYRVDASTTIGHHELGWRGIPGPPVWFKLYRIITTSWMSYILLKYILLDLFRLQLSKTFGLNGKLQCILVGRFVFSDNLASLTVCLLSFVHIVSRCSMSLIYRPFKFTALYFLLLSSSDLKLVYSRLKTLRFGKERRVYLSIRPGIELTFDEAANLSGRQRFVLETMCFRYEQPTRIIYLLRSNRMPESHLRLRRIQAMFSAASALIFSLISLGLGSLILFQIALDSRYMRVYHDCDPHLKRLDEMNPLTPWSMTPTLHHSLTGLSDLIENFSIWIESSLVVLSGVSFTFLLNYDLITYWQSIDDRVRRLRDISEHRLNLSPAADHVRSKLSRSNILDCQVGELQAEIMDFFGQLRLVDTLFTESLNLALGGWLLMATVFTYYTQVQEIELPFNAIALLASILTLISLISITFLRLQRHCTRSYTPICSLMAFDRSQRRLNFKIILEQFQHKKTCYMLLRRYPFQPTTFLTIVGYSFSSFFLITGIFRERNTRSSLQGMLAQLRPLCPNPCAQ